MPFLKKDKLWLFQLFRSSKMYFLGIVFFLSFLIVFPIMGIDLSPLIRSWGMYKDPMEVQKLYLNRKIVINDSVDLKRLHLQDLIRGLINGPLEVYINMRTLHKDGRYIMDSHVMRRLLPDYLKKNHSVPWDTITFKKVFLNNITSYTGIKTSSVSIYNEWIGFDANGFAHTVKTDFITVIK